MSEYKKDEAASTIESFGEAAQKTLKKHGINSLEELDRVLCLCENFANETLSLSIMVKSYESYCKEIGKGDEAKAYVQRVYKELSQKKGGQSNG